MMASRAILGACIAILSMPGRSQAQDGPELMYIGESLGALRLALKGTKGFTPVAVNQLLREQIGNPDLVVIIVPPPMKKPPDRVRLFRLSDSSPADFEVVANDLDELRKFRTNSLLQSAQKVTALFLRKKIDTPEGQLSIASLLAAVKKEPNAGPFVGGLLATEGVQHPELTEFTRDYQRLLLEEAKKNLDLKRVKEGNAYYFGPTPVTKSQLAGVSWHGIGKETIDNVTYQKVWIGASLILVKPTEVAEYQPFLFFPDGMDGLKLDPAREKEFRQGYLTPTLKLDRLPVIK